jgi:hypothetical protein
VTRFSEACKSDGQPEKKPLELETSDGFSPYDEERKEQPANKESGGKKRQMQVRKGTMPPYGGEKKGKDGTGSPHGSPQG